MKKLLALVMAAAMVLALVPMTAMAVDVSDLQIGGTVTLDQDIELNEALSVTGNLTINLNGKTIKKGSSWNTGDSLIVVKNGGSLTINGTGTIDGTGLMVGIKLGDAIENNLSSRTYTLNVNGGTIKGDSYGISGNGYRHGSTITITGGTVTGAAAGIFHPQEGKLTIKGNAVVEGGCGVEIRAGEINVSENAVLRATAAYVTPTDNGSGMTMEGVALGVSQHATNTDLKVNVSGGTFEATGSNGKAFEEANTTNASPKAELSVSGGSFEAPVSSANEEDFITGGNFKTQPSDSLVKDNSLVIDTNAGDTPYSIGKAAEEALATAPAGSKIEIVEAPAGTKLTVAPGVTVENGTGNDIAVNGETIAEGEKTTVPTPAAAPIPETGDGMGLFVFAGLALISMLGMVAMKKREEY